MILIITSFQQSVSLVLDSIRSSEDWNLSLFGLENPTIVMEAGGALRLCVALHVGGFKWEREEPTSKSTAPFIIDTLCRKYQRAISDYEVRRTLRVRC